MSVVAATLQAVPDVRRLLMLPVAMSLSFSIYVVITRSLRDEHVLANLFHTAFRVFLSLSPLMPKLWITPTSHDLIVPAGIGTVGLLALHLLDRAAAGAPVSATAPVLYIHVPGLVLARLLMQGTGASRRALVGCAAIVALVGFVLPLVSQPLPGIASERPVQ